MIQLDDGNIMIMWQVLERPLIGIISSAKSASAIAYVIVDETGNALTSIEETTGALSDCAPILVDGKVTWYVTNNSRPGFYRIDPDTMELTISRTVGGLQYFEDKNNYTQGQFVDVPETAWYAETVRTVYEAGLMIGTGTGDTFSPNAQLTNAEVAALTARIHSIYLTGDDQIPSTEPWYKGYIEYAKEHELIGNPDYPNYWYSIALEPCTRSTFISALADALPEEEFTVLINKDPNFIDYPINGNYIYNDPDVNKMYKAGIITGTQTPDGLNLNLNSNITRAEAAIVARIIDPSLRISGK